MKVTILLLGWWVCSAATGAEAVTNRLSFHLLAQEVPGEALHFGTAKAAAMKLVPQPVLCDPDFLAFDVTNHLFVTSAETARRLTRNLWKQHGKDIPTIPLPGDTGYEYLFAGHYTSAGN